MCQLFADDAKIFRSLCTTDDIIKLQDDLNKLTEWSAKWQLPFNIGKCKSLHIGRDNQHHIYEMNGHKLDQVQEEKDLGVLIDDELKFHKQTSAVIKNANMVLRIVKKSFACFDSKTPPLLYKSLVYAPTWSMATWYALPLLYKSLVRPHLEYGNVVWGPSYKADMKAIEGVQRRATKLIPALKNNTYKKD